MQILVGPASRLTGVLRQLEHCGGVRVELWLEPGQSCLESPADLELLDLAARRRGLRMVLRGGSPALLQAARALGWEAVGLSPSTPEPPKREMPGRITASLPSGAAGTDRPGLSGASARPNPRRRWAVRPRIHHVLILPVLFILAAGAAWGTMPRATVTVCPQVVPYEGFFRLTVVLASTSDAGDGVQAGSPAVAPALAGSQAPAHAGKDALLPGTGQAVDGSPRLLTARPIQTTFVVKGRVSVSGQKVEPLAPSTGQILLINNTAEARRVPAGARVATAGGVEFTLSQAVVVPPAQTERLLGVPVATQAGRALAQAVAVAPGESGNVGPGTITRWVGASGDVARLAVVNPEPFSGGKVRIMPAVAQTDVQSLRAKLQQLAGQQAESRLRALLSKGDLLLPAPRGIQLTDFLPAAKVGDEVPELQGQATVTVSGWSLPKTLVETAVRRQLAVGNGAGKLFATPSPQLVSWRAELQPTGEVRLTGTARDAAIIRPDVADIQRRLQGQPVERAEQLLAGLRGVGQVRVDRSKAGRFPPWARWVNVVVATPPAPFGAVPEAQQ
ncbi:MAG: baseplate J/gp47 family protein [Firmicutes bacterium]|nr:baseplate J/gp47 family protein [Bacillota bacterium]